MQRKIQLADVDLNLLVALNALLDNSSVTLAAKDVGVTQSAMSHSLRRLRLLFDDKLLVRGGNGMVLTPKAQSLLLPLRQTLLLLQDTIKVGARFEPRTAEREFCICATDHTQFLFIPQLNEIVKREAPNVSIFVRNYIGNDVMDRLSNGEIDVVLSGALVEPPPRIVRKRVCEERMLCLVRAEHSGIGDTLSLEDYVKYPHLLVAPVGAGPGVVDELLAARDLQRHISIRVQNFMIAPWILKCSDLILTVPDRMWTIYNKVTTLRRFEPPLDIPAIPTFLFWHERNRDDPAMKWLRDAIERAFATATQSPDIPDV